VRYALDWIYGDKEKRSGDEEVFCGADGAGGEGLVELLALLIEVAIELAAIFLSDGGSRVANRKGEPFSPVFSFMAYAFIGLALGVISLSFFPQHFISNPGLRFWNLILSPIVLGMLMGSWGNYLRRNGKRVTGVDSYVNGFALAFLFALVRYIGAW